MPERENLVPHDDSAGSMGRNGSTQKLVTWKQVEDASEQLLDAEESLLAETPDHALVLSGGVSVPLVVKAEVAQAKCFEQGKSCCALTQMFCLECFASPATNNRRKKKKKTVPGIQGHLWKLNSEIDFDIDEAPEAAEVRDLKSWRRRYFLCKDRSDKIAVMYVSEKNDGEMTLACALGIIGTKVSVKETTSPIELDAITPETLYWAKGSLKSYDVAFGFDNKVGKKDLSAYDELVPQRLYPFIIAWRDDQALDHQLVLAAATEEIRVMWASHIKEKLAQMVAEGVSSPSNKPSNKLPKGKRKH